MSVHRSDIAARRSGFTISAILLLLFGTAIGHAQSTEGWKTFSGAYFSFQYPPGWTITQPSQNEASVNGPNNLALMSSTQRLMDRISLNFSVLKKLSYRTPQTVAGSQ